MSSSRMPSSDEIHAVRGVLIALIVLGHNTLFSANFPRGFSVLYNFHVASFLLLPFLFPSKEFSVRFVRDRAARYLVPHYVFFLTASLLFFFLVLLRSNQRELFPWVWNVVAAAVIASEEFFDRACGLRIFWFLPALMSLVVIRSVYAKGGARVSKAVFLLALLVHLFVGVLSREVKNLIPYGLHIALFVFPLGLLVSALWRVAHEHFAGRTKWILSALFAGCMVTSVKLGTSVAVAGGLRVYSLSDPFKLFFHDLYILAAFFSIVLFSTELSRVPMLRKFGEKSLGIFLVHSLVWQFLLKTFWWRVEGATPAGRLVSIILSWLAVLVISWSLIRLFDFYPALKRWIFPRDSGEWPLGDAVRGGRVAQG
jgi:hypothetical protein